MFYSVIYRREITGYKNIFYLWHNLIFWRLFLFYKKVCCSYKRKPTMKCKLLWNWHKYHTQPIKMHKTFLCNEISNKNNVWFFYFIIIAYISLGIIIMIHILAGNYTACYWIYYFPPDSSDTEWGYKKYFFIALSHLVYQRLTILCSYVVSVFI